MIQIKKTGEGYYLATLGGRINELGRQECQLIKRDLTPIIKGHREISIDMKGVNIINEGGIMVLGHLKELAENRKCRLRFINVAPVLNSKITSLIAVKNNKEDI